MSNHFGSNSIRSPFLIAMLLVSAITASASATSGVQRGLCSGSGLRDAPGPVLDFFAVAAAGVAGRGGLGDGRAAARFVGVHRRPCRRPGFTSIRVVVSEPLKSIASCSCSRISVPLVPNTDFAVAAEAVAVDRRIGDDDLLVRVGDLVLVVALVVARAGELERAVHVVVALAVGREDVPAADARDRQRLHLAAVVVLGRDEDAGRVELMAAELGHQAAARAIPQPPADQFFERRAVRVRCNRLRSSSSAPKAPSPGSHTSAPARR